MGIIYSSCAVVERDYILGNRGGTSKHWERRGMGGIRYVTWDKLRYMGRVVTYVAGVGSKAKEQRLKKAGVFGSLLWGAWDQAKPLLLVTCRVSWRPFLGRPLRVRCRRESLDDYLAL